MNRTPSKSLCWYVVFAGFWAAPASAAILIVDPPNSRCEMVEAALKAARSGDLRVGDRTFAVSMDKNGSLSWQTASTAGAANTNTVRPHTNTSSELGRSRGAGYSPKDGVGVELRFAKDQAASEFLGKESFGHGKALATVNRSIVYGKAESGADKSGFALSTPGGEEQAQETAIPRLVNVNGDCELGLREWHYMGMSGPLELDSTQRRSGKHAITVKGRTQYWGSAIQKVLVKANQKYLLTAWLKVESNGLPLSIDGMLFFKDGTRSWKGTLGSGSSKAGEWTLLQGEVTFADTKSIDHLQLSFATGKNLVDFSVDDFAVVHLP
jgi:hypothetical protein